MHVIVLSHHIAVILAHRGSSPLIKPDRVK